MKTTRRQQTVQFYNHAANLGFSFEETETLRRAQKTLHTWAEHECNGYIQRKESTGKPYICSTNTGNFITRTSDREKGALARVAQVMSKHPELVSYHQTDPRGCSLYIVTRKDVPTGEHIGGYYSRGFAVCIG